MNIFENYKNKIISILNEAASEGHIVLPDNLNGINVEKNQKTIENKNFKFEYNLLKTNQIPIAGKHSILSALNKKTFKVYL